MIVHANLIAAFIGGYWRGALIEGPSGAGKSDFTLRALDQGFRLVADDRTLLWTSGGKLFGRAPDVLHGLIEVRGLDVVRAPALNFAQVRLICICAGAPERIPERQTATHLETETPSLIFAPQEASAVGKLYRALQHLGGRP